MQASGRRAARTLGRAGNALRERDHGGGDHPVPSRTRQLSPPSPRVLRGQPAGGQDVALAQGVCRIMTLHFDIGGAACTARSPAFLGATGFDMVGQK